MAIVTVANSSWVSGNNPSLGNNQFTVMFWTFPTSTNQNAAIFGHPGGLGGFVGMGAVSPPHNSGNRIVASAPGVYWVNAGFTYDVNTWQHVAWSVGNGSSDPYYLYKNGVEGSLGTGGGINASNTFYGVGRKYESGSWNDGYQGGIAYLKVWDKQLTALQIQQEMYSRLPLFELSSLRICLELNTSPITTTFPDISGSGLDGGTNGSVGIMDGPPI